MYYIRILCLLIIPLCVSQTGCQQDGEDTSPPSSTRALKESKQQSSVEVTAGGKVWKIDPNLSYQATGVWTNPNPRPLTSVEAARLKEIQVERDALQAQLDALDIEWGALLRIDQPQIKTRYSFGKPPHRGTGKIINLGEFPMEIEDPPHHSPE